MDEKKFDDMLQFAVDREIESVRFYTEASHNVKHSGTKELFLDFARQEEKHKQKLEEVRKGKISLVHIQNIPDLKISDYLVDSELTHGGFLCRHPPDRDEEGGTLRQTLYGPERKEYR